MGISLGPQHLKRYKDFALLLFNLDEIGHTLAPRFDPNAAIRRHAAENSR